MTGVTVHNLLDPKHDYSPRLRESIARHDMALEILQASAQTALLHATCPLCGARNPDGVAAQKKDARAWRIAGSIACVAIAIATWLFAALAWLVVVIVVFLAVAVFIGFVRTERARRRWSALAMNGLFPLGLAALAFYAPRFVALYPLFMALQFARKREDPDAKWIEAKKSFVFDVPYR